MAKMLFSFKISNYKNIFNYKFAIIFAVVFISIAINLYSNIWPFQDLSWVEIFNGDSSFLTERVLLAAKYPNIEMISSIDADYGSEHVWLVPFLWIIDFLRGERNPLNAYYAIIISHVFFAHAAILVLARYFIDKFSYQIIFILSILSSSYYFYYLGYAKPDANILLFFIVLALICIDRISFSFKYTFFSIALIAIGFSIKWWSLFLIIPYFIIGRPYFARDLEGWKKYSFRITVLGLLLCLFCWNITLDFWFYILKMFTAVNTFIFLKEYGGKLLFFVFLSLIILFYFVKQFFYKKNEHLMTRGISLFLANCEFFFVVFIFSSLPSILWGKFIKSYGYFIMAGVSGAVSYNSKRDLVEDSNFFKIWIKPLMDYCYFPIFFIILFFVFIVYYLIKKQKQRSRIRPIVIYLGIVFFAILTVIQRNNLAFPAMLLPLIILVFIKIYEDFVEFRFKTLLLLIIVVIVLIYQTGGVLGSILYQIKSRLGVHEEVKIFHQNLDAVIDYRFEFTTCERSVPKLNEKLKVISKSKVYCIGNVKNDLKNLKNYPWILSKDSVEEFIKAQIIDKNKVNFTVVPMMFMNNDATRVILYKK